ncbi:MAG: CPBP family intramembrane glutamic endopeptidase, partial [Oscillospiraceae bacterium]
MKKIFKNADNKRIVIFLLLTFIITYAFEIGIVWQLANSADAALQSLTKSVISFMMLLPALCVVITRFITKEGFTDAYIKPNFKGNIKYYILAWLAPALLVLFGAVVYFMIFPNKFDINMGYMSLIFSSAGANLTSAQLRTTAISQIVTGIVLSPILNIVFCFGEELGWRGYLLPKMSQKFKLVPMLLINGLIWGLWHAPITIIGHNYGVGYWGYPFTGILAMCVFCTVIGTLLSYLTVKTHSCIPAAIAHSSLNGLASAAALFTSDGGNPFIGPIPTGIIGGIGFIIAALAAVILMRKAKLK